MRILIYGAGVIGSLYAVLFAETGYDTSIYARGKRLEFLKKNGLLYKKNQNMIFFSKNSHIKQRLWMPYAEKLRKRYRFLIYEHLICTFP